ncbi:MAG: type II toxin-antitoxin system VapC family toxin [Chloroflexi bacterium]|nr:type II toxin-antitoxin system VapC family toxin [Chloroflexota bacterium]
MKALLDTHVFLWWITNRDLLSPTALKVIGDGANDLFFSAGSAWEIAIKTRMGKLRLSSELERFIAEQLTVNAFQPLPIQISHALRVHNLPDHHRDPFDRILIAQAQLENLPILSANPLISQYDIQVLW